jgi:hypothetical protein
VQLSKESISNKIQESNFQSRANLKLAVRQKHLRKLPKNKQKHSHSSLGQRFQWEKISSSSYKIETEDTCWHLQYLRSSLKSVKPQKIETDCIVLWIEVEWFQSSQTIGSKKLSKPKYQQPSSRHLPISIIMDKLNLSYISTIQKKVWTWLIQK